MKNRDRVVDDARSLVREHPLGALATALGAGYLLGGGLFTKLTSRLLHVGWRLALPFVLGALDSDGKH